MFMDSEETCQYVAEVLVARSSKGLKQWSCDSRRHSSRHFQAYSPLPHGQYHRPPSRIVKLEQTLMGKHDGVLED